MLTLRQITAIKRLHWVNRWALRQIGRHLRISRKTIKKSILESRPCRLRSDRASKLDRHKPVVLELLRQDPTLTAAEKRYTTDVLVHLHLEPDNHSAGRASAGVANQGLSGPLATCLARVGLIGSFFRFDASCGNKTAESGVQISMRIHSVHVAGVLLMATKMVALGDPRMISIGERRIAIYCEGEAASLPTVILVPAGGRTAKDWDLIQPEVGHFTRVCSYDHANFGQSDAASEKLQSVDEVVADLHSWLQASHEKGPFVFVTHSNAGIYVRRFETLYKQNVAGLVFLDSAHEEQALRLHELDPAGPAPDQLMAKVGWYTKPGQRLEWHTQVPLIVIGRGTPFERKARDGSNSQANRMAEEQFAGWDRIWTEFQKDLAKRSSRGEYRLGSKSGHWIQKDEPALVIQAIRDVCRMASAG